VTYWGIAINIVLAGLKVGVGVLSASLALIADGIHSLSDMVTDGIVLLGLRLGSKRPDQCHPYGHGRLETFSAGLVALVLIFVGAAMIRYAALAIAADKATSPHLAVLVVAIVSIGVKECLFRVTRKVAVQSHSPALYANAWHHRSDALSSVAVLVGFVALKFGFEHGDRVAAMVVGLMIIWVGVQVLSEAFRELAEGAVDSKTVELVREIIRSNPRVRHWHNLRTRTVGREIFLDVHILVEPSMSVADAHRITENLERELDEKIARPVNITIHVEPDVPELRKEPE